MILNYINGLLVHVVTVSTSGFIGNLGIYSGAGKKLEETILSRGETQYICKFCQVPLHKGECFQSYHTLKHY